MVELHHGPTNDFVAQAAQNRIAETVRIAFEQHNGFAFSDSELRSWRNSVRALANALSLRASNEHGVFLEFRLPLSSEQAAEESSYA